jgi:predicted RNA-binding Zn ribbon-like protein
VRALRPRLRIAFEGDESAARSAVDALLAEAPGTPALDVGGSWRLVLRADRGALAARVGFAAAFGVARFVAAHGRERLRRCAAERCEDVFVDLSRNGSRRYCSAACSSRTNVAAFRRRAREGEI